jgi:hypothetical protein
MSENGRANNSSICLSSIDGFDLLGGENDFWIVVQGLINARRDRPGFIRSEGNRGFVTQVRRTLLVNGGHYSLQLLHQRGGEITLLAH